MLHRKVQACLALVIVLAPSVQDPASQHLPGSFAGGANAPTVTLRVLLRRLGKKCDCVFTIEEAWADREVGNSMEVTDVPERMLLDSPDQVMKQLTSIVPNFTYDVDNIDSRIVHVKDKRLAQVKGYLLDQELGPFEFQGRLFELVEAIASKGVPIRPGQEVLAVNEPTDRRTEVTVKGKSMQVRTALTNFIPLDQKPRGQILWVATTSLSHEGVTYVKFPM